MVNRNLLLAGIIGGLGCLVAGVLHVCGSQIQIIREQSMLLDEQEHLLDEQEKVLIQQDEIIGKYNNIYEARLNEKLGQTKLMTEAELEDYFTK